MYLAIDYGRKRIGLALGTMIPYGAGFLDASKKNQVLDKVAEIVKEKEVELIVFGFPGEESILLPEIKSLAQEIADKTGVGIIFEEEHFTTVEAQSILNDMGKKPDLKSGEIDELAAILILEQFINRVAKEGKINNYDINPSLNK